MSVNEDEATEELCGQVYRRTPYGQEKRGGMGPWGGPGKPCHDCGVYWGQFHAPGCDVEECPRCGGQTISCTCNEEDTAYTVKAQAERIAALELFVARLAADRLEPDGWIARATGTCRFCGSEERYPVELTEHTPDCLVAQARTLLGTE